MFIIALLCPYTAVPQDPPTAPLASEVLAAKVKARIVIPALKSLHKLQQKLSPNMTRQEMEDVLMQQSILSENDYHCLALISLDGELLACAPAAMAPLVNRVAKSSHILQKVQHETGSYLVESHGNPKGHRTYDLILPVYEGGAHTNAILGMYYSRFYPPTYLLETVNASELPDDESFYILSSEGDPLFSSRQDAEGLLDVVQPELRNSRSSMRSLFRRMQQEKTGRYSYISMAEVNIGLVRHDLSWAHMELPGTRWIIIHNRVKATRSRDADNPLLGLWAAHPAGHSISGEEAEAMPLFNVSMVQEDTWWCMRGGGKAYPFRAEGRCLEGRMLSNRISQLDDGNQVVFSLQGRYDEDQDQIYVEIYRQHKRRVITTSCTLIRLPLTQENHEQNQNDIPLRLSTGIPAE